MKTALLIIDMQNDFCLPGAPLAVAGAPAIIPKVKEVLAAFRASGLPVFHVVRHYRPDGSDVELTRRAVFLERGGACIPGTRGAEIVADLAPLPGEFVVVKKRWSAFFQTELDLLLRRLGVTGLAVAGVQTPNCVRATVYDAVSLDYEVVVLADATAAQDPETHRANLRDMENIGVGVVTVAEFVAGLSRRGGT